MKKLIRQAFEVVHDGYSADRVVADPERNEKFLAACRSLGLDEKPQVLNSCLLNARKASFLSGISTSRRTNFADQDEYQFASEIAARFLEHRSQVTLDQILSDPTLAAEFDKLASQIAPGFSSLKYRWAALCLRKTKRLKPELLAHVIMPTAMNVGRVDEVELDKLPSEQGIYIFFTSNETLYVGEGENLKARIKRHLEHSDIRAVAHHFWQHGTSEVFLELRVLPTSTTTRVRRALEAELISSRRANFNIKRS